MDLKRDGDTYSTYNYDGTGPDPHVNSDIVDLCKEGETDDDDGCFYLHYSAETVTCLNRAPNIDKNQIAKRNEFASLRTKENYFRFAIFRKRKISFRFASQSGLD